MPEDGSRLMIHCPGFAYDSDSYCTIIYGSCISLNLVKAAKKICVERKDNEISIVFSNIVWFARFPEHRYRKPDPAPNMLFRVCIRLENDELLFVTEPPGGLDDEPLQVTFPAQTLNWKTTENCQIAFAHRTYGALFNFPSSDKGEFNLNLILPIAGLFRPKGGVALYADAQCDQEFSISANISGPHGSGSFIQLFQKGKSEYTRTLRIHHFLPGENYTTLAKWYRSRVKAEGRFVSLVEKIAAGPETEKLAGAVIWKHNVYSKPQLPPDVQRDWSMYITNYEAAKTEGKVGNWTAKEVFDTAYRAGFDRVCIFNTGWNHYGFDSGYPTRFPVNPERGTEEDFSNAAAYGRSLSPDYIYSVHDNYRDVYPNSPEFKWSELIHNIDGVPVRGGIWRGGRCYLMCGKCAFEYAKRDLPHIAAMSGRGAIYLDVQGCVSKYDCYHREHSGSRRNDADWRLKIFSEAKKQFGAVATEGAPHDFAVASIDLGAYWGISGDSLWNMTPIPLFQMVYHDSIFNFTGEGYAGVSGMDLINYEALYCMLPHGLDSRSLQISKELRKTFLEEMLSYKILSPDIACSSFADGTSVYANFGDTVEEGIPPHSFIIQKTK